MPTEREGARYLVIFSLGDASHARLTTLVPNLTSVLKGLSEAPIEQAFRSATADTFGYFIRSKLPARQLVSQIQSPDRIEPFLTNSDSMLIVQIGDDFSGFGRSKVPSGVWLELKVA
jgi:hypothetical protein